MTSALPCRLQSLVERLTLLGEASAASVARILSEAAIEAEDLGAWLDFDHDVADSYGRRLVHDGGFFELMVMSWDPGDVSMIHDHGHSQWGAVQLFGPAEHAVFQLREGCLTTRERDQMSPGTVLPVGPALIHQMGNTTEERFASLHLYGCFGREGGITDNARLFHFDEGTVQRTGGGVFFELPEEQILAREDGVEADFATRLRFRVENLNRMLRKHGCLGRGEASNWDVAQLCGQLFEPRFWARLWTELDPSRTTRRSAEGVLEQELRAAARLQHRLLEAGMADAPSDGHPLQELLEEHRLSDYGAQGPAEESSFLADYLGQLRELGARGRTDRTALPTGSILDAG